MKKKILSLALVAMSMVSFGAMAQTQTQSDNNIKKVCTVNGKECPATSCNARHDCRKANPLDGISLSDAQKDQIKQLNQKRCDARKKELKARKDEKMRNDSIRGMQRKADRKAYLADMKKILGNDNYILFLENIYINGDNGRRDSKAYNPGQHKGKMHGSKDFRKGAKGPGRKDAARHDARGQRPMRAATAETAL